MSEMFVYFVSTNRNKIITHFKNCKMKKVIKQIVEEINQELSSNAYSNEMGLLMSYGENFGQCTEPDFEDIVTRFSLTRESLNRYIDQAKKWACTFNEKYPKDKIKYRPWGSSNREEKNYWQNALETLHCVFMSGIL